MRSTSDLASITRLARPLLAAALVTACSSPTSPPAEGWGTPVAFSDHREVEVGVRAPDGTLLAGTLYLPPGEGRYPALVMHFGSTAWTRATWADGAPVFWVRNGFAVLSYDKRGVGASGGDCCDWRDPEYFPLLGRDVLAMARMAATHHEVRADLVGVWGFSLGGGVVPVAAALGEGDVAFTIIGSGPAVTLNEELLFSDLTGSSACSPSGLSDDEIERRWEAAGPGGFDPRPYLERMDVPGLWVYGGLDRSVPVERSIRVLHDVRDQAGKDFTTVVLPDLNHSWVRGGGLCQSEGPGGVEGTVHFDWLRARFDLW